MASIIDTNVVTQIAIVVKDIEETKKKYAEFFGVQPPPTIPPGPYEVIRTTYKGEPAPDAGCFKVFFDVGPNVALELIQPNGVKSTWQDHLDEHGEGVHHIAFNVKDMESKVRVCEELGIEVVQRGIFSNKSGEYAYLDTSADLKCIIELLENY